jgi:moderate conductance mechanosensitive channel
MPAGNRIAGLARQTRLNMKMLMTHLLAPNDTTSLSDLLHNWRQDALTFLHHDAPKLAVITIGAFVTIRILRVITGRITVLQTHRLPSGIRFQQVRTLAGVINGVGVFAVLFVALLQILSLLGINLGPLLASAGIAGLAIGFGAQTLVHDVINGFFILMEDHFDIGDTIRTANVKGTVELMSLRRTVLRDDDGTVHIIPNSQITIVSNMTRDWSQVALRVTVAYDEPSDRIISLLQKIGEDVRHDPGFEGDIVSDIQVPGIERVGIGEADYMMLVKTRPGKQYGVSRELRRRIKEEFAKQKIKTPGPGRVFVVDQNAPQPS